MRYLAIVWKEGRRTLAEFPDCPGCQTFAEPGEEIAAQAHEALEGWLEAQLLVGRAPTPPRRRTPRPRPGRRVLWVDVSARLAVKLYLRWTRQARRLSQAELAKLAGVSQPAIAKLEHPRGDLMLGTVERIARALGARFDVRVALERKKAAA